MARGWREGASRTGDSGHGGKLLLRASMFGRVFCAIIVGVVLLLRGTTIRLLGDEPQFWPRSVSPCLSTPCALYPAGRSPEADVLDDNLQLSVEGAFQLVGLAFLAIVGADGAPAYGWLFGLAPWIALAVSTMGLRPAHASRAVSDRDARPLVVPLIRPVASSLAAQLLIGAGPITVQLFAGTDEEHERPLGHSLPPWSLWRLPVFLFTAVQPSMLPAMAAQVAADRKPAFRFLFVRVFALMGVLSLSTTLVTSAFGPWA